MKKRKKIKENNIYRRIDKILEIPKEICSNIPKITITGFDELVIENFKGILEYTENFVSINTYIGVISVVGIDMKLENMRDENIKIKGIIDSIEFERIYLDDN